MTSTSLSNSVADRLRTALAALIQDDGPSAVQKPNVTNLCRLADVSRNSLYRDHADVLLLLRAHQQRKNTQHVAVQGDKRLRKELDALRTQRSKLVAMVDHYYLALRETSALLARRERELAELRRSAKSLPTALRRFTASHEAQLRHRDDRFSNDEVI